MNKKQKHAIVRYTVTIVCFCFLFIFILLVLKDFIIKSAIEMAAPGIIGAKIEMGSFSLGLFDHKIHIRDFKMYNPPGYPDAVFLEMPEVSVDADMPALLKGRMHFRSVVFHMDKMVLYRDKQGKLNVDSLKIIEEQQAAGKGKPVKLPVFKIDDLDLNLGQVILEDYTHAPPVRVEAYNVNIKDQKIRDINGLPKLVAVVIVDAMKPTAIRSAGLFAAEALLGVGFLPALAFSVVIAKDDVNADLGHSFDAVYQECLNLVHDLDGTIKKQDKPQGQIFAKVYGCDITIHIQDKGWNKSHIMIKARQFMLPKFEIANGLLYQLTERLK